MSKLRIKQMISAQVPTTVQPFNFCRENKKAPSPTLTSPSEDTCPGSKNKLIKKSNTMREETFKKTQKIGLHDAEFCMHHKPSLKIRLSPEIFKKKIKTTVNNWKSISPKSYLTKQFSHNLSIQDLIHNHKSAINPLLQKNHQALYKTKSNLLEKLRSLNS